MPDLFYYSYLSRTFDELIFNGDEWMVQDCIDRLAIDLDHDEPCGPMSMEKFNEICFGNFWDIETWTSEDSDA